MRRARIPARALAIVVAAPFAVAPAGVAGADVCGFYGPGFQGPGYCSPPYNEIGGEADQSDSSWPPGFNYVSGSSKGSTPATPIVPVGSGP